MNIFSKLTSTSTDLEINCQNIKNAYYITDLKFEGTVVSLHWYAKIPLLGRLISLIRFQFCSPSSISEHLKTLSNTYKQTLDQAVDELVQGQHLNQAQLIAQIQGCDALFNQFLNQLTVKAPLARATAPRFDFKAKVISQFNETLSQEKLQEVERQFSSGKLIDAATFRRMGFVRDLIKQIHAVWPLEEINQSSLQFADQVLRNYGFLKRMDDSLATFTWLATPGQRLADLKQQIEAFDRKQDKLRLRLDPKRNRLMEAICHLFHYSSFKSQYPQISATLAQFYRDVSVNLPDLSRNLKLKILSFVPHPDIYKLADMNEEWKGVSEIALAGKVPQVYAEMLEDIQRQLLNLGDKWNDNLKIVFSMVQELRENALTTEKLPSNLQEALNYLNEQKQELIQALSLASPEELETIKLPCAHDLVSGTESPHRCGAAICQCSVHSGLKASIVLSTYRQFIQKKPEMIPQDEAITFLKFFVNLVQLNPQAALKVVIHLSTLAKENGKILDKAISLLWDFYARKSKDPIPFADIPDSEEKEAFLDIACKIYSNSKPEFADYKIERVLDKATFLQGAENKLEELERQVTEYMATLPKGIPPQSLMYDSKMQQLREVVLALNDKTFKMYYPTHAKVFDRFYQRVSFNFFNVPNEIQQRILSFIPTYKLFEIAGIDEAWKGPAEQACARRVPQVYADLLEKIHDQLSSYMHNKKVQAVCQKLKEMEEEALALKNPPLNLQEAHAYLKNQKNALVFALSLAKSRYLRRIKLPCLDSTIHGTESSVYADNLCRCEIHRGIAESMIWSEYNQVMRSENPENVFNYSNFDSFFGNLMRLDEKSALKVVIHLYKCKAGPEEFPSLAIRAIDLLCKKYKGISKLSNMPDSVDKEAFLDIVCRIHPNETPEFAAYKVERALNKAAFLQRAENKLEELKRQVTEYMATLPKKIPPQSLMFDSKMQQLREVVLALNDKTFKMYYPTHANVFDRFYQRVSFNLFNVSNEIQQRILSFIPTSQLFEIAGIDETWKGLAEEACARRVPQVYADLLDEIHDQLAIYMPDEKLKAVCQKLKEMEEEVLALKTPPVNLQEAHAYLKNQKDALVFALSLAESKYLRNIKLPCLDRVIYGESLVYANKLCRCEIHKGIADSIIWSEYNQIMQSENLENVINNYRFASFFKDLMRLDEKSALKVVIHLYRCEAGPEEFPSRAIEAIRQLWEKYKGISGLANMPDSVDKEAFLDIVCRIYPNKTQEFAAYKVERALNKAAFLQGVENKLEELKRQVEEYMANLPANAAPISLLNDSKMHQLRGVVVALNDRTFKKLHPDLAKRFTAFYQRVSIQLTDLESDAKKEIFSYLSPVKAISCHSSKWWEWRKAISHMYQSRTTSKAWKGSVDEFYASRVPALYCEILDLVSQHIQPHISEDMPYFKEAFDKLAAEKQKSAHYSCPTTQAEVSQYWQDRLNALRDILSVLPLGEFEIELPCLDELGFRFEQNSYVISYLPICECPIHENLAPKE